MEIYTDGATSNNGYENSEGGWAYVIVDNNKIITEKSGYIPNATNNICELTAIIEACSSIKDNNNYIIYSDSSYCVNCYKQKWYKKWLVNGWINSAKKPVANKELWEKVIPYFENEHFIFEKIKGHSVNKWNNYVDEKAVQAKRRKNG